MHAIFAIPELLHLIFVQLCDSDGREPFRFCHDRPTRLTFSSLVRTSCHFNRAALPLLWARLSRVDPFLNLLAGGTYEQKIILPSPAAIAPERLERFLYHSYLIRRLNLGIWDSEQYYRMFRLLDWVRESRIRNGLGEDILPRLASLSIGSGTTECFQFVTRLVGRSLRSLRMDIGDTLKGEDDLSILSKRILELAPCLTSFHVRASEWSNCQDSVIDILTAHSSTITHVLLNEGVFKWLVHSRHVVFDALQHLTLIDVEDENDGMYPIPFQLSPGRFPALESIIGPFRGKFWSFFLLDVGSSIRKLKFNGLSKIDHVRFVIGFIGESCPLLHTLNLSLDVHVLDDSPRPLDGILRPLFACKQLVSLQLSVAFTGALSSADFLDMADAWQELEIMKFYTGRVLETHPALQSVSTLCTGFPRLRVLEIVVDARDCPPPPSILEHRPSLTLENLSFHHSPIQNPEDVAAFLHNVCPVAEVSGFRSWVKVAELMKRLRTRDADLVSVAA